MRLLHTADWHLGRLFHGHRLTEDQAHVLDQLFDFAKDARPDAILVAGDLYDRAVPPTDAVELLDDVITRIQLDLKIPTIMIAGNHDSPKRVEFGARLMAASGLHLVGDYNASRPSVVLEDAHGPVHVVALPYVEPAQARDALGNVEITDHQGAMAAMIAHARPPAGVRSVLVAHAFVTGACESESERPLTVGGAGTVSAALFNGFHFTALGHLHAPQQIGAAPVHYSGSILKYSLSEVGHCKGVNLVEMDKTGAVTVEHVALPPRRDVRAIQGRMEDLLRHPPEGAAREDYLFITLLDEGLVMDAMARLREVYPNAVQLSRAALAGGDALPTARGTRTMDDAALFESFFEYMTGVALTTEQRAAFTRIAQQHLTAEAER